MLGARGMSNYSIRLANVFSFKGFMYYNEIESMAEDDEALADM